MSRMEDYGKSAHEVVKSLLSMPLTPEDRIALGQVYAECAKAAAEDRKAAALEGLAGIAREYVGAYIRKGVR